MSQHDSKPAGASHAGVNGPDPTRIRFELALDVAARGDAPLADKVAYAAEEAGADLLFVLPSTDGNGISAVLRFASEHGERFLQVRTAEGGLETAEGDDIDSDMLRLARASVEVLLRIGSDPDVARRISKS